MYEAGKLVELNLDDILPNRFQPRIYFNDEKLYQLAESIQKYGVIQPIVVRKVNNKYEIVAGERRYKASKLVNKQTIPAVIVKLNDRESEEIALLENIQRQGLTPIEEAVSYKRILDMGYISQSDLAKKIGKDQATIEEKVKLLSLDDTIQEALLDNKISERHARSLLKISSRKMQRKMLNKIITERLTVKRTDEAISRLISENINLKAEDRTEKLEETKDVEMLFNNNEVKKEAVMDIDKTLREARDINENTNIPPINLVNPATQAFNQPAYNSTPVQENETNLYNQEPNIPVQSSQPTDNKFVYYAPPVEEKVTNKDVNNVSNVNFDSIFNSKIETNDSVSIPSVNNQNNSLNFNTENMIPQDSMNQTVSPNNINNNFVMNKSEPVNANNNFGINPEPVNVNATPQEPQIQSSSIASAVSAAFAAKDVSNNVNSISNMTSPNINTGQVQNNYSTGNIPSSDIFESAEQKKISEMPMDNINQVKENSNFREAIRLIRECADKIERLGYSINLDEIDLTEKYQVIFNINK